MNPARIILAASSRDRRRALAFVRYHVRRLYGGTPSPSQIFLLAERNGRTCGTIALDFALSAERFPLESIYRIDFDRSPWPFERENIAQLGRWWTTRPGVAVRLMHSAHMYALANGKRLALVEAKARIIARLVEFGMAPVEVPGAVLEVRIASLRGEGYYQISPPPRLYMFDLQSNATKLEEYISRQ